MGAGAAHATPMSRPVTIQNGGTIDCPRAVRGKAGRQWLFLLNRGTRLKAASMHVALVLIALLPCPDPAWPTIRMPRLAFRTRHMSRNLLDRLKQAGRRR